MLARYIVIENRLYCANFETFSKSWFWRKKWEWFSSLHLGRFWGLVVYFKTKERRHHKVVLGYCVKYDVKGDMNYSFKAAFEKARDLFLYVSFTSFKWHERHVCEKSISLLWKFTRFYCVLFYNESLCTVGELPQKFVSNESCGLTVTIFHLYFK